MNVSAHRRARVFPGGLKTGIIRATRACDGVAARTIVVSSEL